MRTMASITGKFLFLSCLAAAGAAIGQPGQTEPCPYVIQSLVRYGGSCDAAYYECEEGDTCTNIGTGGLLSCGAPTSTSALCYIYEGGTYDPNLERCVGGTFVMAVVQGDRNFYLNPTPCGGDGGDH